MPTFNGTSGNDILNGGGLDDIINGGSGSDTLYGNDGNDTMNGGSGIDYLYGGEGNDTMDGGSEIDYLWGGNGNDTMRGGSGVANDVLYGEAGDDWMDGGSGNDTMAGGEGNDTLLGGSGNDVMYGDNGTSGFGSNIVVNGSFEAPDVAAGNFGIFGSITGWTSTFGDGIEVEDNAVMAASDGAQLVELDSNNNSNMIQDVATGSTGSFLLQFDYSPRPGVSAASNGIEVWWNGVLLDTLTGDVAGFTTKSYNVVGAGATTALEFRAIGTSDSLGGFIDNVKVSADLGGNDVLEGGSGDDFMSGDGGNDTLTGGSGNDAMYGGYGFDSLTGGSGNDGMYGNEGNDTLAGDSGNDSMDGGAGVDLLTGGLGADTLTGGTEADTFIYTGLLDSTAASRDLITDWDSTDLINLAGLGFTGIAAGAAAGSTLGFTFDGTNTVITAAGSDFSIALTGNQALTNADFIFA